METIVLRDDKTEIDYTETAHTVAMREQVRILNDHLAQLDLRHRGQKLDIPIGRRIFNESFDREVGFTATAHLSRTCLPVSALSLSGLLTALSRWLKSGAAQLGLEPPL